MRLTVFLCVVAMAAARPSQLDPIDQNLQDLLDKLKLMDPVMTSRRDVTSQDFGLEDVTHALKEMTGFLSSLSKKVGPALNLLGKRELDLTDINKLTDITKLMEVYKQVASLLKRDVPTVEVQDFGLEDVTGAIKGVTGYLADIAKTIGPALSAISVGKRDALPVEYQNTDWDKVLDDLKGVGKDIADIFANVGPAVASVVGKRDVVEIKDFGLEDVTGAIKGVTGYLADIAKTIGPALSAISVGKRDALPIEYQNTDWDKVLDDLKGIGKDVAGIFANVGPAVASVVGKRDAEIQDFGLEDVTGAIKGVTGYLADIAKTIGPALSAISIGKRDVLPVKYENTDWDKVLDDLKGVGKDIADIFANVGPAVASVVGKRDAEIQDFGLEDVTGAIKGVTGYLADIAKTIGPALSAISVGKRDALPVEYQNTDWNKVLDDLKGIGKDVAGIFANVGPAVASVVGKRDAEIQDFGLEDVTGAIKGVTGYLADIAKTIGPALSAISVGKRDEFDLDLDLDLALEDSPDQMEDTDWNQVLEHLKGIGKDLGSILVSVAPAAIITAVG